MRIYLQDLETGLDRIKRKDLKICVSGVGTVGLPLATFLAKAGFQVIGLDINPSRINDINSGSVVFEYSDILKDVVTNNKLRATDDANEALCDVDVVFVCVPTPLNKENEIDISNLINVAKRTSDYMKQGMIFVVESSVSIGTTQQMGKIMEENTGMKIGKDLGLAYCPERYNPSLPGEKFPTIVYNHKEPDLKRHTLDEIGRVVGGIDEKSRILVKAIYSQIIHAEIKELSSIEAAEATKLLENIFRDVNIALVNELAKVYTKLGLNIYEIIDAAKTKPFAFLPHYPGAGVGGECIPVDTWYLIKQAEKIGLDTKLLRIAREVNDSMPNYLVDILEKELSRHGKKIDSSKITILGLSYKKNIHDIRLSPTFTIINILKSKNANFVVCDPLLETSDIVPITLTSLSDSFKNSDAILMVTDHDVFHTIDFVQIKQDMRTPIIIDGRNFFDEKKVSSLGFAYKSIGKSE